jgi:acetyltransferase-like isoleucine patch superfamily enzyme
MSKHDWVKVYTESIDELSCFSPPKLKDFYYSEDLRLMGIQCGTNCLVHKTSTIVNSEKLILGNNVRIDGFCVISCGVGISIGNYVHIASHVVLMGGAGIEIKDYASVAASSKVFSVSDDVMGRGLVGPCVNASSRHLHSGKVVLDQHSVMCINSAIMPNSTLNYGTVLLPFSLLLGSTDKFGVYSGNPAKYLKARKLDFLKFVE